MSSNEVNLSTLHANIKAGLRAVFTAASVPTIDLYAQSGAAIIAPAIYIELDACGPNGNGDAGTGQFSALLEFSAWVVVSSTDGGAAQLAVRRLALSVAAAIRGNRWQCPVGPAEITDVEPAVLFADTSLAYYAFRVCWTHAALVGTSAWDADALGVIPSAVYLGVSPEIGAPHEPDYTNISA